MLNICWIDQDIGKIENIEGILGNLMGILKMSVHKPMIRLYRQRNFDGLYDFGNDSCHH
jgi:hypothetical protein